MSQNSIILPTVGVVSGLQMTQDTNNALDTLNTLASGASAPASSEAGQFWHDTTLNILKIRSLDNTTWISLFSFNETAYTASFAGINSAPQGRLTLSSGLAVMTADISSSGNVYYTPYIGNNIPIYNGTNFNNTTFTQLTMVLSSGNQTTGNLYDLFVFLSSATPTIGANVAWSTASSRSSGTAITQSSGIWINSVSSTLKNGSSAYSVSSGYATYVGTVYMTGNGQCTFNIKPAALSSGTNNILGVFNAYNRVGIESICRDSKANWANNASSWNMADLSNTNRISWVDGLQQVSVKGSYTVPFTTNSSGTGGMVGINLDSSSATPGLIALSQLATSSGGQALLYREESFPPQLGFHYLQAMDALNGAAANITFLGAGYQSLVLQSEY